MLALIRRTLQPCPFTTSLVLLCSLLQGKRVCGNMMLECERERMSSRHIFHNPSNFFWNHSISCPAFQWEWSLARVCCYDTYDRFLEHPYCCNSELYKLVVAMGFVLLVLLSVAFLLFFCWFYNLPHHLLYLFTCRKFLLNEWLSKTKNGPYVDPSFYSKEPFWSREGYYPSSYPLQPMPPRIFYPAPPTNMKFRWEMGGDIPLFVLASRQFHRNPYSARPREGRTPPQQQHVQQHSVQSNNNSSAHSRRSSLVESERGSALGRRKSSGWGPRASISSATTQHNQNYPTAPQPQQASNNNCSNSNNVQYMQQSVREREGHNDALFVINVDEKEAANELREAIRLMDDKEEITAPTVANTSTTWIADQLLGSTADSIFMTTSSGQVMTTELVTRQRESTSAVSLRDERSMEAEGRLRYGGKVSVQLLNQQLSNSLGLSLNNLPNIQVIGNFGRDGMETIVEDEDPYEDDEDYSSPPRSPKSFKGCRPPSANRKPARGISSALDGIVSRARQTMPGAIPEEDTSEDVEASKGKKLNRRNSAPVNF